MEGCQINNNYTNNLLPPKNDTKHFPPHNPKNPAYNPNPRIFFLPDIPPRLHKHHFLPPPLIFISLHKKRPRLAHFHTLPFLRPTQHRHNPSYRLFMQILKNARRQPFLSHLLLPPIRYMHPPFFV